MDFLIGIVVLLVLAFIAVWLITEYENRIKPSNHYEVHERANMPIEIGSAKLVYSEQLIRCNRPVAIVARVDQVFRTAQNVLVPIETKTRYRAKAYRYDQVEMSAQAYVLRQTQKTPVAEYGYVRIVSDQYQPRYVKVDLLSDNQLEKLYWRRQRVVNDQEPPRPTDNPLDCSRCEQSYRCQYKKDQKEANSVRERFN